MYKIPVFLYSSNKNSNSFVKGVVYNNTKWNTKK
jgi:hypothetical protein